MAFPSSKDKKAAFDGFGGGDQWGAFGSNAAETPTTSNFSGGGGDGFGSFPSSFSAADGGGSGDSGGFFGSGGANASSFKLPSPPKPKKVYDKTPLKDPPQHHLSTGASFLQEPRKLLGYPCLPAPSVNPLNGNIIGCRRLPNGEFVVMETDPRRGTQVMSSPVLTAELQRKIAASYNVTATSVSAVLKCTVGTHRSSGHVRPRVAALIDLMVLENNEVVRVIAIWQWGYGASQPIILQSILSPPSGIDFVYNPESLLLADSCVFVSGASEKGPYIFICKPTVREKWSANLVGKESVRIADMAVTSSFKQSRPYLAIALTDGSMSVWSYQAAMSLTSKSKEALRRLLYPLCRLDTVKSLSRAKVTQLSLSDSQHEADQSKELGHCTSVMWMPCKTSQMSMQVLAASFQCGVMLYHIALPSTLDSKGNPVPPTPPTSSTQLSSTTSLKPFGVARWPRMYHSASSAWLNLGPHESICVGILLKGVDSKVDYARILAVKCQIPIYNSSSGKDRKSSTDKKTSIRILSSNFQWQSRSATTPWGILSNHNLPGIVYYSEKAIHVMKVDDKLHGRYGHIITSQPPGLASDGTVHLTDAKADRQGILHVYSTMQCDRRKLSDSKLVSWSTPTLRHWLVRTLASDCKAAVKQSSATSASDKSSNQDSNDDGIVYGGTSSEIVCEIASASDMDGLMPSRIIRSSDGSNLAVAMRSTGLGASDCIKIAFFQQEDNGGMKLSDVVDGRDVSFLPTDKAAGAIALILGVNGGTVREFKKETVESKEVWKEAAAFRPIVGAMKDDHIDCRRLQLVTRQSDEIRLLAAGTRTSDDRGCLIVGSATAPTGKGDSKWSNTLPSFEEDPIFWFEDGEEIFNILPLPNEGSIQGGYAVATNTRVLVLDPNMNLVGSSACGAPARSVAPVGSFAVAFCGADFKIRYVCGLKASFGTGVLATLPGPLSGYCPYVLLAVRPDRFIYGRVHVASHLREKDQSKPSSLPEAITRPALLLEPLLANVISTGGPQTSTMPLLRTVVERFGRKITSLSHSDGGGIGDHGTGITPRVFELLSFYNLDEASSWLLTGTVSFHRAANSRILPPWIPMSSKSIAAKTADTKLHLLAHGDQYFTEYVKSPDQNMSSTLPRHSDPSAFMCNELANKSLFAGNVSDALKLLDMVGTESADSRLLQLALTLQMDPSKDPTQLLEALCHTDSQLGKAVSSSATGALAALSLQLKSNTIKAGKPASADFTDRWMKQMAPSLQRGRKIRRMRPKIIGESAFLKIHGGSSSRTNSKLFVSEAIDAKHIWNEGPNKEKEHILTLDSIQEWFGRTRPVILGKEGAENAVGTGATTLADILNKADDDSFGGDDDDYSKDGWVEGVGQGHEDKDKLCAYYRISEGDDDETPWKEEGFADLTKFENKAVLVGVSDSVELEQSTSSVDEGESGKVKALYDIVFKESGVGRAAGFAIPASRGKSLDIGIMHGPDHDSRQKCTVEFWFWIPQELKHDIVLARRTFGSSAGDLDKVCLANEKDSTLWELILSKSGELEFRTISGDKAKTKPKISEDDSDNHDDDDDDDDGPSNKSKSTALFGRWNHACIIIKQLTATTATTGLLMKGESCFSKELSFAPPDMEADEFAGASAFDGPLTKSYLVFGLNHPPAFRMTEIRAWAMERVADDIRTFMTEYLESAEIKRKFRVKIKKKGGGLGKLAAPSSGGLAPPGQPRGTLMPPGGLKPPSDTTSKVSRKNLLAPPGKGKLEAPKEPSFDLPAVRDSSETKETDPASGFASDVFESFGANAAEDAAPISFGSDFGATPTAAVAGSDGFGTPDVASPTTAEEVEQFDSAEPEDMEVEISPLWDSAIPLSEQVRSSAAAALIRGPPATRHFGGNRGGLPDYRELERFGVGAISICGSEKTIVWRDDQVPPGLTYPIGASGAVVSDQMDEDGSEFLCCFQAKEKRMVVFELSTRTAVVELQMTTKLNYWRFLPPEAGEDTLCFMLITPVGGFHWMPLDDSPRPRQVWKRGGELQGKKIVCYEEGGTNGQDGPDMLSKVGMLLMTNAAAGGRLESWLVPVCGDSQAICASDDVMGACLCCPPGVGYEAWMPLLLFVVESESDLVVCVSAVTEGADISIALTEVMTDALIELAPYKDFDFTPPTLSMGTWPEVLCCSLGSTIVIIVRRKGLVVAYELADTGLELIAEENVGHYVVDAVMRYSAVEGGAEIVLLMSDSENPRDGRVGTFCFRSAV